ncbi:MAG: ABC transporter permease subunit [Treponema sp.]|nr:ABC transporter permease subunit [Treponema sp.]
MGDKKKTKNASLIIFKRELKSFYSSPIAYIVAGLFLLALGIVYFLVFYKSQSADLRILFQLLPYLLSIFVPALTMRVFAEEKRSGSLETLMTLPVTETDVVCGKMLASFVSTLLMVAPTLLYIIPVRVFGNPDFGPIIGGYAGTVFLSACFVTIGVFSSSVTKNQIVALFVGIAISVGLTMIDTFLVFLPTQIVGFFQILSINAHFESISRGIIDTRDIIYFVSLAALFFVLTIRMEQKAKK